MLETVDRAYDLYREKTTGDLLRGVARSYLPDIVDRWAALVQQEAKTRAMFPMTRRRRLWLYGRGFLSQADALYDFEGHDHREYLSNYARYARTPEINGRWSFALDNKLAFHWLMQPFENHRPALYGLIESGTLYRSPTLQITPAADPSDPDDEDTIPDPGRWVLERLREKGSLVIKPVTGGSGDNVLVCHREADGYRINDEEMTAATLRSEVADLDGYLVFEYVTQAAYSAELFPDTANTIRVLTMFPDGECEPFIAASAHRIGTSRSEGLDNVSRGGLSAEIDHDTGTLSRSVQYPHDGDVKWHDEHPDTGVRIEGVRVPGWSDIVDGLLAITRDCPYLPYIGWDLIITAPGEFVIIEANNFSDVNLFQVHTPLLSESRVRRFYAEHGVI